jgi:DNA-binding XRE family transcriptional regulator
VLTPTEPAGKRRSRSRGRAPSTDTKHQPTPIEQIDWRAWWQAFGKQHREIREFLGFSQEQLARMAGVSQGAVSRLEAGKGLATPMVVILKINLVIRGALHGIDPSLLKDDLRQFLELERRISPPLGGTGFNALPITDQPEMQQLVRLYRTVPERNRDAFFSVVQAVAVALSGGSSSDGDKA